MVSNEATLRIEFALSFLEYTGIENLELIERC